MKILASGSSGFIGGALIPFLTTGGHRVTRLVRRTSAPGEGQVFWSPEDGTLDPAGLEGFDAVVNLAGESVTGRWTADKKRRIYDSRVKGTRLLSESLARLARPPKVLISASASGYYGDCGEQVLREDHPPGSSFLAQVCRDWEAATEPAARSGVRVVNLRMGLVLSPAGGALARLLPSFRLGLGGTIGSGRQYFSWVALDDVVGIILHVLVTDTLESPVNVAAPNPVTNREFTKILGLVLKRPTVLPIPAFAVRLILGEMADDLLLASARLDPARLLATDYRFRYTDLEATLRYLLGRSSAE
jgi:uncharacterized protein (TIGR01777 family)